MNKKIFILTWFFWGTTLWESGINDPDLGWHLFGGAWIEANKTVPSVDPINGLNLFWHDYHWLAQLFIYQIFKLSSYWGIKVFFGLTAGALMALIAYNVLLFVDENRNKNTYNFFFEHFLLALLFGMIYLVSSYRPNIFVLFFIAISHLLLFKEKKIRHDFIVIFILTALSVNLHVYWIFIPVLWLIYKVFREKSRRALLKFGILLLAGLLSPYGTIISAAELGDIYLINYTLLLDYLLMPAEVKNNISELTPLLKANGDVLLVGFIAVFFYLYFLLIIEWERYHHFLWSGFIGIALVLGGVKYLSLAALLLMPTLSIGLQHIKSNLSSKILDSNFCRSISFSFLFCCFAVIFAACSFPTREQTKLEISHTALGICEKLANSIKAQGGESYLIMTSFDSGGWCRWGSYLAAPKLNIKVTADGRTQWVQPANLIDSFNAYKLSEDPFQILKKFKPNFILLSMQSPIFYLLSEQETFFEKVAEDRNYLILKSNL
ncbi:MAG TPA: hypothetical protein PKD37_03030 [Oligoflexia bacterium]|nr:hypothetical protein [Oligoflexia bacterium]HMP26941.1 hypothetical protein [Oligoflexia bacterium]